MILNKNPFHLPPEIEAGVLFGYSIFTTFTVEESEVKGFVYHLERLINSSKEIFNLDISQQEIIDNIQIFLKSQTSKQMIVRVTICPQEFSLVMPEKMGKYSILVTSREMHPSSPKEISLQLIEATRELAHHKTSNMLTYFQARAKAHTNGYSDALLYHENKITEGPTWNILFGKGDTLTVPKSSDRFLPGITQKLLLEHLPNNFCVEEKEINIDEISDFEYAFYTSGGIGIVPISKINEIEYEINPVQSFQKTYSNIFADHI